MESSAFRFKQFSVDHQKSSMKVGVDAVLLGSWAKSFGDRILDVGTGCGIIALMMAQRNPKAHITAIDIDDQSIEEATHNFEHSPWADRLIAQLADFNKFFPKHGLFDLIISNPPFFHSGINDLSSARLRARHEGDLNLSSLLDRSHSLLKAGGRMALIFPYERYDSFVRLLDDKQFSLLRVCHVRNKEKKGFKRSMVEVVKRVPDLLGDNGVEIHRPGFIEEFLLTMFDEYGLPSKTYRDLCHDFYLKF